MSQTTGIEPAGQGIDGTARARSHRWIVVAGSLLAAGGVMFAILEPARAPAIGMVVSPVITAMVAWVRPPSSWGSPPSGPSRATVRDRVKAMRDSVVRALIAFLAGALVFALIMVASVVAKETPRGEILAPIDGQHLPPGAVAVTVDLSAVPDDRSVWAVVERANGLFPKEPEFPSGDGRWMREIVESGRPHRFSLLLLMVTPDRHREIQHWLDRGHDTGRFLPLPEIPGTQLDVVKDLVQTAPSKRHASSKAAKPVCAGEGSVGKVRSHDCSSYARVVRPRGLGRVNVYNGGTRRRVARLDFRQHPAGDFNNPVKALAWSPDGRELAAVFHHDGGGHIEVRSVATGREVASIPIAAFYHWVEFTPNGRRIRVADGTSWRVR